ncbi:MAG: GTPase Era [Alphaproteobacteria bacterium]|nr:GTPase Era [Alphaproteobacteria bacterium]
MTNETERSFAFIAVLGAPNVGKSTLINRFVGTKVTIVTPKVQTTRSLVRGIRIEGASQLVFVDTPGIFEPKRRLDRAMVAAAWSGAADADAILLLVDAEQGISKETRRILEGLKSAGRSAVLAINKIDRIKREKLLGLSATLNDSGLFAKTFMISALDGDGVEDLLGHLAQLAPAGPWLFPEDQISDLPARLLAAEITREKLFLQLRQELPYALAVTTESFKEREGGDIRIEQIILVQRASQKAIVLGEGGSRIKDIGSAARHELEGLFGTRVHLFLHVKVRKDWLENPEHYRDLGLDYRA